MKEKYIEMELTEIRSLTTVAGYITTDHKCNNNIRERP
jgi:hypothetical protein